MIKRKVNPHGIDIPFVILTMVNITEGGTVEIEKLEDEALVIKKVVQDIKPKQITNLAVTASSPNSFDLTWTGNSNVDHYNIYRGETSNFTIILNQPTFITTQTKYSDTPLKSNTIYYYKVSAVDPVGNISLPSMLASGRTLVESNINNEIIQVDQKRKLQNNTEHLKKEAARCADRILQIKNEVKRLESLNSK